jgi:hypothetical protein
MYPTYRKYAHNKTFYKVISKNEMIEITILGNTYCIQTIYSNILPDRNFIEDVIKNENDFLIVIDEGMYNEFLLHCQLNLKKVVF